MTEMAWRKAFVADGQRQSGRTTRMIEEAIRTSAVGRVGIVVADAAEIRRIRQDPHTGTLLALGTRNTDFVFFPLSALNNTRGFHAVKWFIDHHAWDSATPSQEEELMRLAAVMTPSEQQAMQVLLQHNPFVKKQEEEDVKRASGLLDCVWCGQFCDNQRLLDEHEAECGA